MLVSTKVIELELDDVVLIDDPFGRCKFLGNTGFGAMAKDVFSNRVQGEDHYISYRMPQ